MIGKIIVHKVHGLCKVVDEVEMNGEMYLKVESLHGDNLSIYCPIDSLDEFFRDPVDTKEANKVIEYMKNLKPSDTVLESTKQQRTLLYQILYLGDVYKLGYLNVALLRRQKEKLEKKQNLSSIEAKIYYSAKKMLCEELAYTLNKTEEDINQIIVEIAGV